MIARYTRPAMAAIWSEQRKYENWLRVEIAATTALARAGIVPPSAVDSLQQRASFTIERIHEIEAETRHDVLAFTTAVAESVGEDSRWLHYGLTSTDVVDTAQGLALVQASALIREGIVRFRDVLRKRAVEFQHTPIIGRTHGVHAEPTTFGMKLLLWYAEMGRNLKRFDAAAEDLRVGKISGAVGAFGKLKPAHEAAILAELGLQPALISTQVLQRDRHAAYITTLAVLASTLDKIALEIRTCSGPRSARPRSFSPSAKKAQAPCRTSEIQLPPKISADSPGSFAETPKSLWKMLRFGTSATSPTPPPNASSSPIQPSWRTICWTARPH